MSIEQKLGHPLIVQNYVTYICIFIKMAWSDVKLREFEMVELEG